MGFNLGAKNVAVILLQKAKEKEGLKKNLSVLLTKFLKSVQNAEKSNLRNSSFTITNLNLVFLLVAKPVLEIFKTKKI